MAHDFDYTPYLSLAKPRRGAKDWDGPVNANFDKIDDEFKRMNELLKELQKELPAK